MVGDMLSQLGFYVTIGETFGASQRGGSVMSHLRVSNVSTFSPQIPKGRAHMVVSLEPTEAIRVLKDYGNPKIRVLCNTRPVYSMGVICGEQVYPAMEDIRKWVDELSEKCWFINATDAALKLGNPIFANIICVGALAATGTLPLSRANFEAVVSQKMTPDKVTLNLSAYDIGSEMVKTPS
jgi:indolepyruvate ferredoxin oxidoreductase beta subunit